MDIQTIEVQTRDGEIKSKDLRLKGLLPAEFYGKGVKNTSIQLNYGAFRRLFKTAGKNTVIELSVDGKAKHNVLVHDIQRDPISDKLIHVDFINVRMDQVITAQIPLKFIGNAPAVKDFGGILTYNLDEISVKCLPKDLIQSIEVSVAPIVDLHSFVRVKDLVVPEGITVTNPPEEVVVTAVLPKEEVEAAPVVAAADVPATAVTAPVVAAAPAADAKKK